MTNFWAGAKRSRGAGAYKIIFKDNVGDSNLGSSTYPSTGLDVTVPELEKVHFANAWIMSGSITCQVAMISSNVFKLNFVGITNTSAPVLGISGQAVSGALIICASILGE